jgi:transcriptional regulator with XRE-family HTH domain
MKKLRAFGRNVYRLRKKKSLSQEELAHRSGLSYNTLNTIENGKINPTIATIFAMADGLEIHVKELFDF